MERKMEPTELMDEKEQAEAYANSDHSAAHMAFIARFSRVFPDFQGGRVADLCCGPADPTIRFAMRYRDAKMVGYDGAEHMLAIARKDVEAAGLSDRITLVQQMLPIAKGAQVAPFDVIICNGSMHHLPDSAMLWETVKNIGKSGTMVFVVDLLRPATPERVEELVQAHTLSSDPELMKQDFGHSLRAAFRPEEVREQLDAAELSFRVEVVSNRHMMIYGRLR